MQNNYYFLRRLSKALHQELMGMQLLTCFSQNKDELILGFAFGQQEYWIRAMLSSDFTCLSFPKEFFRAKRNSVDLFRNAIGKTVQEVRQFENERSFALVFENKSMLIFKMHGSRANILWWENHEITEIFKNNLEKDWNISPDTLDRKIQQTQDFFVENGIKKTFPTFDKDIMAHLALDTLSPDAQWQRIATFVESMQSSDFYVCRSDGQIKFCLWEEGEIIGRYFDALQAISEFSRIFSQHFYLQQEKEQVLRILEKRHHQTENYIYKTLQKLEEVQKNARYEEYGHILMANLHTVPPRSKEIELFDFYTGQNIMLSLKENLSAQKNAEVFYRKAKNQKIEISTLEKNIEEKEKTAQHIKKQIAQVKASEDLKNLRKFLKTHQITTKTEQEGSSDLPFKIYECAGFQILVGRNAKNNDLLTLHYAHKEDLWLHARDVTGSHVVIKHKSGKTFPSNVIEYAAQLASFYSKRKNDTLCPVIVTPKKYVRKQKGMPDGSVIVDREEVIMVRPQQHNPI